MDTVNEALVPNRISVQVVTEAPIDEWINHISKGYESVELEPLEQQRKNILGTNPLKAFNGAVPVHEFIFLALKLEVITIF